MLVLTRCINNKIIINENIEIIILDVQGKQIKIGINAPKEVTILRSELFEKNKKKLNNNDEQIYQQKNK